MPGGMDWAFVSLQDTVLSVCKIQFCQFARYSLQFAVCSLSFSSLGQVLHRWCWPIPIYMLFSPIITPPYFGANKRWKHCYCTALLSCSSSYSSICKLWPGHNVQDRYCSPTMKLSTSGLAFWGLLPFSHFCSGIGKKPPWEDTLSLSWRWLPSPRPASAWSLLWCFTEPSML